MQIKNRHSSLCVAAILLVPMVLQSSAKGAVIAYWRMEQANQVLRNLAGETVTGVKDSATETGEGSQRGNSELPPEEDHLITFNGNSDSLAITSDVPPEKMFRSGFSGGEGSYDSASISNVDGALFFPQDLYGDEFSTFDWTVEFFFRTQGDQSQAGAQQLILNQEGHLTYGVVLNQGTPGSIGLVTTGDRAVELKDRNYADGKWYYAVASYDSKANVLRLRVTDPEGITAEAKDSAGTTPDVGLVGNLFIGRHTYELASAPRTFLGLIDEVRISDEVLADDNLIGLSGKSPANERETP